MGRLDIIVIDETLTAQRFIDEVIRPRVLPYAGAIGDTFILKGRQRSPPSRSIVNDFLEEQGITRMQWPAVSLDPNPIEHLWDTLGRNVTDRLTPDSTLDDLLGILQDEWIRIPQNSVNTLINSMQQRCFLPGGGGARALVLRSLSMYRV